jgi:RNase P/RNase MRP subunit p30
MRKKYLAIDLRGYPSTLYETVCQVVPVYNAPSIKGDILTGVEITHLSQLKHVSKADLIFAAGGSPGKNRKFLKSKKIHVLAHPYPLDSFQARLAAEYTIGIELCFAEILNTSGYKRAKILKQLQTTIKLAQKYHAPLIITSGATCQSDVLSPRTLVAFGKVLGLDYGEAKAALWNMPKKVLEGIR